MKVKYSVSIPASYGVLLVLTLSTYQAKGRVAVGVSAYLSREFRCLPSWSKLSSKIPVAAVYEMNDVVDCRSYCSSQRIFLIKCSKLQKYEIVHSYQ